jgi:hypothetical protein
LSAGPLLLVVILALALTACGKSEAQREGETVAATIGRMRDAPRQQRQPQIDILAALTPEGRLAKKAQTTCLQAYRSLQEAHAELDAIQATLAEAKSAGSDPDPTLVARLVGAEDKIQRAQEGRAACAAAVAELQRSLR